MTRAIAARARPVWHWHEQPRLVSWAATSLGRVAVWLAATAIMPRRMALTVAPLFLLVLIWPERRRMILSLGSLWVAHRLLRLPWSVDTVGWVAAGMATVLGGVYLVHRSARAFRSLPGVVRRHPLVTLHLGFWLAVCVAWGAPAAWAGGVPTEPWGLVLQFRIIFPFLLWRLAYLMLSGQRGSARRTRFTDHLCYCLPVYGGSNVPFGKGHDYLAQRESADREADARAQLAGLKLLALAWVWKAGRAWIGAGIHGEMAGYGSELVRGIGLELPRMHALIAGDAETAVAAAWASVLVELVDRTLAIAIQGHLFIGALRLFGFNVFRNTYKPLTAESILEFWNRFYHYFKELLVEFFFYPVFVGYFKRHSRIRMFAAVMAAAFAGNVYYHVVRDLDPLIHAGPAGAWDLLAPRVFYCLLLGLGVYGSMERQQGRRGLVETSRGTGRALGRVRRIAGVWLFFALIHIWNIEPVRLSFAQRTRFFFSLLGLG